MEANTTVDYSPTNSMNDSAEQVATVINKNVDEQVIHNQYMQDVQDVENFLQHKTSVFSSSAFRRLTLQELVYKNSFANSRFCGFTRRQIKNIVEHPEYNSLNILRLSQYMMGRSGYYKRLIEYFANSAVIHWTVDLEPKSVRMYTMSADSIQRDYINCVAQVNKFRLDQVVTDIFRRLYIEDVCYAFISEDKAGCSIFFLDPRCCRISRKVSGNVFEFEINRGMIDSTVQMPQALQDILDASYETQKNNYVPIPYNQSLCLKYNSDFAYPYPPYFNLIADILLVEDYKELAKAKTEADAYKLVWFKIPLNDNGQLAMPEKDVLPTIETARQILPESWGVVPSSMDLSLIESKSTVSDDTDKVQEAVDNYYGEAGVSKALISSASSGSELKLSMKVDSSDIYRLYRKIEAWMQLQLRLRGFLNSNYDLTYHIHMTTIYDVSDYIDTQLKLANASIANKSWLFAADGLNSAKMLGNEYLENVVLKEQFNRLNPLSSSYTQSSSDNGSEGGAPTKDETEISDITQTTRDNDGNDPDNRI